MDGTDIPHNVSLISENNRPRASYLNPGIYYSRLTVTVGWWTVEGQAALKFIVNDPLTWRTGEKTESSKRNTLQKHRCFSETFSGIS
jgi:hypothetical protein